MKQLLPLLLMCIIFFSCKSTPVETDSTPEQPEYPEGIATAEYLELGDLQQWILMRGASLDNPVLLWLHGGPGYPESPFIHVSQKDLEQHYIVVNWDQRGAGKSFSNKIPKETMTLDQFINDTHELTQYLLKRFNKEKIYLLGHSWGSLVGIYTAHQYPELYHAYIGAGQVVDLKEGLKHSLQFALERAKEDDNAKAIKELSVINPDSIDNPKHEYSIFKWVMHYNGLYYYGNNFKDIFKHIEAEFLKSRYYAKNELKLINNGSRYSAKLLNQQLFSVDIRKDVTDLDIPTYFLVGRYDYNVPAVMAAEFAKSLEAPVKEVIWFEKACHFMHQEEPDTFQDVMINKVLQETSGK